LAADYPRSRIRVLMIFMCREKILVYRLKYRCCISTGYDLAYHVSVARGRRRRDHKFTHQDHPRPLTSTALPFPSSRPAIPFLPPFSPLESQIPDDRNPTNCIKKPTRSLPSYPYTCRSPKVASGFPPQHSLSLDDSDCHGYNVTCRERDRHLKHTQRLNWLGQINLALQNVESLPVHFAGSDGAISQRLLRVAQSGEQRSRILSIATFGS
jgi:hypothetical protein